MSQQPPLFHTPPPPAPVDPWMATLPTWLATNLDHYQPSPRSDNARLVPCDHCRVPVLRGFDGPFPATTDTTQLTNTEETIALITHRTTWQLTKTATGLTHTHRHHWNIQTTPATTTLTTPNHICYRPLGTPIPWKQLYTPPTPTPDQPPF